MQAVFRFNGSEEIVVSTQVGGVLIEHIETRGLLPHENPEDIAKLGGRDAPTIDASGLVRVPKSLIVLSKAGARSIASAMMQAAAEL